MIISRKEFFGKNRYWIFSVLVLMAGFEGVAMAGPVGAEWKKHIVQEGFKEGGNRQRHRILQSICEKLKI